MVARKDGKKKGGRKQTPEPRKPRTVKYDGLGSLFVPRSASMKDAKDVQAKMSLYQNLLRTVKKQPKSDETQTLFARYKGEYAHQKRRLEILGILPDSSRPDLPATPTAQKNLTTKRRANASRKHHQAIRQYMETYGKSEGISYLEARKRWSSVKAAIAKNENSAETIKWRNLSP